MFGTAVPEASIYKYRYPRSCQRDIWRARKLPKMQAVSDTQPVELTAQSHLRGRVLARH